MIHKKVVIGMMSTSMLLAACEPVDEAVETDEIELEETRVSEDTEDSASEETEASESTEVQDSEPVEEAADEEVLAEEEQGNSGSKESVETETESEDEYSGSETESIVKEESASYDASGSDQEAEETEEAAAGEEAVGAETDEAELVFDLAALDLPEPEDLPLDQTYLEVNGNIPLFTNEELEVSDPFHTYEPLDELGRVGVADALLDVELMPAEQRGSISHIEPTGWNQGNYDVVSGNWLYNRSHLIGHQLTGYDGPENLMTGTRQFNVEGMLPFENFVASVVEDTEMQVRYRVTPLFEDDNLLAHGIVMEGFSVDDNGETLTFNVFVPNQQDGIELDYETGEHELVD